MQDWFLVVINEVPEDVQSGKQTTQRDKNAKPILIDFFILDQISQSLISHSQCIKVQYNVGKKKVFWRDTDPIAQGSIIHWNSTQGTRHVFQENGF